jgi:cytidine deaminase
MSRKPTRVVGTGTAWIVVDRLQGDYPCYWYTGSQGGRLVEQARADTAAAAVEWGRARTPRVRIRMSDARTYWAGAGDVPDGYAGRWDEKALSSRPV